MANPGYVRSTDGSDSDNGSTWALANATLSGAMSDQSAGDRIWVSDNHSESTASAVTITCPGTLASPCQILCGDDAAEPPTALATTGIVTSTGNNAINLVGSFLCHGLTFRPGATTSNGSVVLCQSADHAIQRYESCRFELSSNANPRITIGSTGTQNESRVDWRNVVVKFGNAAQNVAMGGWTRLHWNGGSLDGSGTIPSALFGAITSNRGGEILAENLDLSALSTALVNPTAIPPGTVITIRNCKLHGSVTVLSAAFDGPGRRVRVHNCDSGDTNYKFAEHVYEGSIVQETTLVKTGGASDGTTGLSWKMVSAANAEYPVLSLASPEIIIWNESTSSITVTVDILHDNATNLTDEEVWLEVEYLGTSNFPQGVHINDRKASVLASAADQATSSATWTTTGMSNPNEQKVNVTFTPAEKGPIICRVHLAKASTTIYVDPIAQVS